MTHRKFRMQIGGIGLARTIGANPERWMGEVNGTMLRFEHYEGGAFPWRAINHATGLVVARGTTAKAVIAEVLQEN